MLLIKNGYVKTMAGDDINGGSVLIGDDGIARYDMTPADFGKVIADCEQMGATLLGGCCGTTPAHIGAITNR